MLQVIEAWKILSDPEKRSRYDQLLRYQNEGWQNRKFDEDVKDARRKAKASATGSWEEFEKIYQEAFYTFNRDFYGAGRDIEASGPYSPLMGQHGENKSGTAVRSGKKTTGFRTEDGTWRTIARLIRLSVLLAMIAIATLVYNTYSGVGRYVPIGQQDSPSILILDTTNGTVYITEKHTRALPSTWKQVIPSLSPKKNP